MNERLAILISGGGTTMREIIKACQSGEVPMDIACVISSSHTAGGIEKARKQGIEDKNIVVIDPHQYKYGDNKLDLDAFGLRILRELQSHGATVVTQNGWLPLTPVRVIEAYSDTIFNQHPGPVPEFGGKGMYGRRVLAACMLFARMTKRGLWTQATAQRVSEQYDQGAVVRFEQVEIFPDDTVDDLQQRVLPVEHRVQIQMLKDLASGSIREIPTRRLVLPGEEQLLLTVKRMAKYLYPKG